MNCKESSLLHAYSLYFFNLRFVWSDLAMFPRRNLLHGNTKCRGEFDLGQSGILPYRKDVFRSEHFGIVVVARNSKIMVDMNNANTKTETERPLPERIRQGANCI